DALMATKVAGLRDAWESPLNDLVKASAWESPADSIIGVRDRLARASNFDLSMVGSAPVGRAPSPIESLRVAVPDSSAAADLAELPIPLRRILAQSIREAIAFALQPRSKLVGLSAVVVLVNSWWFTFRAQSPIVADAIEQPFWFALNIVFTVLIAAQAKR
ncbi:hypothetical protein, partial [Asanoa iriomotensis]